MQCTHPFVAIKDFRHLTGNGKPSIIMKTEKLANISVLFSQCNCDESLLRSRYGYEYVKIPCGKCPACLSNRARDWAVRAYHESKLYDSNLFLTLTYNEMHLPDIYGYSNRKRRPIDDYQRFMKNFRSKLYRQLGQKVRFFSVYEYGSNFNRPHFHAIIFGCSLPDLTFWKPNGKYPIFRSRIVEDSWLTSKDDGLESLGFCTVQKVDFAVCAYVARYCLKKIDSTDSWYDGRDKEFNLMSRRPGLGHDFFIKFKGDIYPQDLIQLRDYATKPPKYYDGLFDKIDPEEMESVKNARRAYAKKAPIESAERLQQLEELQRIRIKRRKRSFEDEV